MDQRWGWDVTFINVVRCKVININLRPNWNKLICKCLVNWKKYIFSAAAIVYVEINGMEVFTLFDSGSSADVISPDFARVSKTRIHTLDKPVPLQLGTVGSQASINYRVRTLIEFGSRKEERYYLDVVNIDRYDAILGAPFMRKFGVRLDFESNVIIIGDMTIQALLPEEEATLLKGRNTRPNGGEGRQVC